MFSRVLTLVILWLVSLASCSSPDDQVISQQRAKPLIAALNDYHRQHGHYPQNLDMLVPTYLTELLITTSGAMFEYESLFGADYALYFDVGRRDKPSCSYASFEPTWQCNNTYWDWR